uniref:Uncharacterized protein n=1 Tax=Rhizophora mucronata TaxID=61149 RepID=A0A2P2M1F7_RHIMU
MLESDLPCLVYNLKDEITEHEPDFTFLEGRICIHMRVLEDVCKYKRRRANSCRWFWFSIFLLAVLYP